MTSTMPRTLAVARPGRLAYEAAARWQELLVERRLGSDGTDCLLLLEHPPVYTLGRGADPRFLGAGAAGDIPVVRTTRGGQVTYHGPGQLVGYPIVDLRGHRQDVRWYVREIEQVLIDALAVLGLVADRVQGLPGVWVAGRKIGSIGIAIRRWVTWHGFALNVAADLEAFAAITPCGIEGVRMTSVAREGGPADVDGSRTWCSRRSRALWLRRRVPSPARTWRSRCVHDRDGGHERHPPWIKVRAPGGAGYVETRGIVKSLGLHTVCEEAQCPNLGECWGHKTATFMLLGDTCTRNCSFCAVAHGKPLAVDPHEPARVGEAVARLGLRHVVVTSVDRDDLPDGGRVTSRPRRRRSVRGSRLPDRGAGARLPGQPRCRPNGRGGTGRHLQPQRRDGASALPAGPPGGEVRALTGSDRGGPRPQGRRLTKAGMMLGLGEELDEVRQVFDDLRRIGCDILTLGQYLRPSAESHRGRALCDPEEFTALGEEARAKGFRHVESGPLVRSSYHAWAHVP